MNAFLLREHRALAAAATHGPAAIALIRRFVAERDDEITRGDPGCLSCSLGTTPAHLETGPCAHHTAVALLAKIDGEML